MEAKNEISVQKIEMRSIMLKRSFVLAMVVALLALIGSSVSVMAASPSQPTSGDWQIGSIISSSVRPVDGICIIQLVDTVVFQGDLAGTSIETTRIVHLGPCDQPAYEVFETRGTFTGTVADATGTFDFQLQGHADAQGNVQGPLVILTGTDGLANLHGRINLTGSLLSLRGAYAGNIHFDS
jgi:hypothetical protein